MDVILNALKAPFSTEAAALTTPAKTAIVYSLLGLVVGALVLK